MIRILGWLVLLVGLLVIPLISAVLGWLPSRADLSWLIMFSFTAVTSLLWFHLEPRFDRTNDAVIASLVNLSLLMSLLVTTLLVPFVIVVTNLDWLIITAVGLALVLCAEVISAAKLRYW